MKRILGINDEESSCCCCGRTDLKRVVWIEHEDGNVEHYGTTCASYVMLGNRKAQNVKHVVNAAENIQRRTDAYLQLAVKHAKSTRPEAARFCRERNKKRVESSWVLFQGEVTTLQHSEHGFYSVPAQCEEQIEALTRNGWEELS